MLDEKFKNFIQKWLYDKVEDMNLTENEKNLIVSEIQMDIDIQAEKSLARWGVR